MKKRIRKKNSRTVIDASGVKAIADMQRYIDSLENYLWRMMMFINGRDMAEDILMFTERGSTTEMATKAIHKFIKENRKESQGD